MRMKVIVLCIFVVLASSKVLVHEEDVLYQWELFKIEHEKVYKSEKEELMRQTIFLDHIRFVKEHNAKFERGEVTFEVAINKFADTNTQEFNQHVNGLRIPPGYKRVGKKFTLSKSVKIPTAIDWRMKGAVTPVKNQGSCSSCWAFSATGSLEGLNFIKTKKLVSLSEQNLVDCCKFGSHGCRGGYMDSAFRYVKVNQGIDTESAYPYEGDDGKCRYNASSKGTTDFGFVDLPSGYEQALQFAVGVVGPVSVAIDAGSMSFKLYKRGVYTDTECSTKDLNHGVLAVGYGKAMKGGNYWLVKNSWGTSWGMNGYIMMARNNSNICGIATMASFPLV